jgi:transposase
MSDPIWKQVDAEQWEGVSTRLEQKQLAPADYALLKELIDTLAHVRQLLENTKLSVKRLKRLLFGIKTEKTSQVLSTDSGSEEKKKKKKKQKGHGRRKSREYTGAIKLEVPHAELMAGTACPEECGGKLYDTKNPGLLIRLVGHPPVTGRIYETQKLRCALCGKLFEASAPAEAGTQKYDPNVAVTLGVFRYGYGLPLNPLGFYSPPLAA